MDAWDAARDIAARTRFGEWGESGRIAVNVDTVYRTLDPEPPSARTWSSSSGGWPNSSCAPDDQQPTGGDGDREDAPLHRV